MLNVTNPRSMLAQADFGSDRTGGDIIDLQRLFAAARRRIWLVAGCGVAGLLLGIIYLVTIVPLYTASVDILIDKDLSNVVDEIKGAAGLVPDEAQTLSQVELLKSPQLARVVVTKLNLAETPEFAAGNPSLAARAIATVKSLISATAGRVTSRALTPEETRLDGDQKITSAADLLQRNLNVSHIDKTYIISVSYTSPNPNLASRVAQAYGDAYLDDQLQSKFEATRRASSWLQDRIAELKQQSFDADLRVQKFRTDNNLISAGGQLVSEQQLSEINTQLVSAQAATAEAKARLDEIDELISSGRPDGVVNDALVSSTINTLRDKYISTTRARAEVVDKLGPTHVQVLRLDSQLAEIQRLIFEELRRIGDSYRSDYNVALSRQQSLEKSLAKVVALNATANTTQVQLRELEREADTFKSLYDNFLQRYQQTVQQQTFPINDARIIKPAYLPRSPSYPKKPLVLGLFLMLGLASGSALAGLREYRERFFRTGQQVRNELGTEFLGFTPTISEEKMNETVSATSQVGEQLWRTGSPVNFARLHPLSAFSETLRNTKVASDTALPANGSKVLGVVSCLPSEGKSTVAANLGTLFAMQGASVVLIDGDLRNPGLTRNLAARPRKGLVELLTEARQDKLPLVRDATGRLAVLPTIRQRRIVHTSELLTSPQMSDILARLRSQFDYVIVDLPPTSPVVDAKAFAGRVDGFVFVVEWGKTSRQLVRNTMLHNRVFHEKCLGVILNKSDESRIKLYSEYGSEEYYASRLQSYYAS
jgi:polysaccharide biosynthesis transport protein